MMLPTSVLGEQVNDHEFECLLEPNVQVKLSAPVAGILEKVLVDRGDLVKKGQTLARLESEVEKAAVKLAEAKVDFGKRKIERTMELYRDNFTSEYNVDEAVTEGRLAELELRQARELLRQRVIRSPINGLVVKRLLSPGEYVSTNEFLHLAQINPLNVEVVVPATLFGTIAVGVEADVFPEQPLNGQYGAKVVTVDRVIDAASGTFGVRLELPNPDNALPAGLKCRVRFPIAG